MERFIVQAFEAPEVDPSSYSWFVKAVYGSAAYHAENMHRWGKAKLIAQNTIQVPASFSDSAFRKIVFESVGINPKGMKKKALGVIYSQDTVALWQLGNIRVIVTRTM